MRRLTSSVSFKKVSGSHLKIVFQKIKRYKLSYKEQVIWYTKTNLVFLILLNRFSRMKNKPCFIFPKLDQEWPSCELADDIYISTWRDAKIPNLLRIIVWYVRNAMLGTDSMVSVCVRPTIMYVPKRLSVNIMIAHNTRSRLVSINDSMKPDDYCVCIILCCVISYNALFCIAFLYRPQHHMSMSNCCGKFAFGKYDVMLKIR